MSSQEIRPSDGVDGEGKEGGEGRGEEEAGEGLGGLSSEE